MRPHALVAFTLLTSLVLAGCFGGGDDGGEPRLIECDEGGPALFMDVEVDQARPQPGKHVHFTVNLTNLGSEDVPTPANFSIQVGNAESRELVMDLQGYEPRFDAPDTVPADSGIFLRRVNVTFPSNAFPGDYVACGHAGDFSGIHQFTVYAQEFN